MIGPYETDEDMLEAILYWQKRAFEAENNAEEDADAIEMYVDMILMEREAYNNLLNKHLELEDNYEILDSFYLEELERYEILVDKHTELQGMYDVIDEENNYHLGMSNYFKQMFLDKQKELEIMLGSRKTPRDAFEAHLPEEESDDPWKYRS